MKPTTCPVFLQCGACRFLDIPYDRQLADKEERIGDLFRSLAPEDAFQPIIAMADPYHYRNKVATPFVGACSISPREGRSARKNDKRARSSAAKGKRTILTGMYARGTHRLIPTDGCLIENEIAKAVIIAIRSLMEKWNIQPYDEDTGIGFMRHAVVRVAQETGEILVTLVTNGESFPASRSFCRELVKRVPQITSVVQSINTRSTNIILGERFRTLYGPGFILDRLCGLSFRISPDSFYQVNALQAAALYEAAIDMADISEEATVIDAYCGTGTIGLIAAQRTGARVIGIESVESAVADARLNAKHNGVENAEFIAGDAEALMGTLASTLRDREVVVIMDPPRAGATEGFLASLSALGPKRIAYISCNPRTQSRDAAYLLERGYGVKAVRPVDMFPQTDHIENIVILERSR